MKSLDQYSSERTTITPEMATRLLEHNKNNRPISDPHVTRIADQIKAGKWKFNGDTIKIASDEQVLDGQHRLWAIINANTAVESIIVRGIDPEAFSTIDTIRRQRSPADVLSRKGIKVSRQVAASAITWLLRWNRGVLVDYRRPENRIENSDIEKNWPLHPGLIRAIEHTQKLRRLCNISVLAMMYYVISSRDTFLAERMVTTLANPGGVGIDDPFFRLRHYFTQDRITTLDPVYTIALIIKAANAAKAGREIKNLRWNNQGATPEKFPKLDF
jgi:hypothetical protein